MTQRQKIEEILLRDGQVDNYHCLDNRLTIRLGAIIHVMRNEGYKIRSEMRNKNCVYILESTPDPEQLSFI